MSPGLRAMNDYKKTAQITFYEISNFELSSRKFRISENKEKFQIFVKYPGIHFIYDFYNMPQKWPIWKPGNKMAI